MQPGFAFSFGPKDSLLQTVNKNKTPGPGSHNIRSSLDLSTNKYEKKTIGHPTPPKPPQNDGVPGPGNYKVKPILASAPSVKIMQDTKPNEKLEMLNNQNLKK